jgi:hypothetical protein
MRRIRSYRPSHTTVVAYLSLFLVLTGGTAVALNGSNTVFSDDISDGQVKRADLGGGAVSGGKVVDSSLTSADVAGLTGGDVNDDSLTGEDVNESSFGQVPSAQTASGVGDNSVNSAQVVDGSLTRSDTFKIAGTATVDQDSVAANDCEAGSFPVSGARAGDLGLIYPPFNFQDSELTIEWRTQTASGTNGQATYTVCNHSAAAIDPPSGSWRFVVID